jgi:hypothetical protein
MHPFLKDKEPLPSYGWIRSSEYDKNADILIAVPWRNLIQRYSFLSLLRSSGVTLKGSGTFLF